MKFEVVTKEKKKEPDIAKIWIELDKGGNPDIHVMVGNEEQTIAWISADMILHFVKNKHVGKGF